jgi:hypothetical protein
MAEESQGRVSNLSERPEAIPLGLGHGRLPAKTQAKPEPF